jgi:hypothetical protein
MEENLNKTPSLEERISKLDPNFNMLRFLDFLGFRESLCEYDNFNKHGKEKGKYIGKYMFGEGALRVIGYGKDIDKFKNFAKFREHFFCNPELQEEAMKKWIGHLIDSFEKNGLINYIGKPLIENGRTVCPEIDLTVLLTLGHISGTEGARQYIEEGKNRHDGTKNLKAPIVQNMQFLAI